VITVREALLMAWYPKRARAKPRPAALWGIRAHRSGRSAFGEGWFWVRAPQRGILLWASHEEALAEAAKIKRNVRSPHVSYHVQEYHYEGLTP